MSVQGNGHCMLKQWCIAMGQASTASAYGPRTIQESGGDTNLTVNFTQKSELV